MKKKKWKLLTCPPYNIQKRIKKTKKQTKQKLTRLHIHPVNLPISSKKPLQFWLPGIIFEVSTENRPHLPWKQVTKHLSHQVQAWININYKENTKITYEYKYQFELLIILLCCKERMNPKQVMLQPPTSPHPSPNHIWIIKKELPYNQTHTI